LFPAPPSSLAFPLSAPDPESLDPESPDPELSPELSPPSPRLSRFKNFSIEASLSSKALTSSHESSQLELP